MSRNLTVDLSGLPQVMNAAYLPLLDDEHRYLVMRGGAGSGKSVFAAQKALIRTVTEPSQSGLVVRKVAKTLRLSCFALLLWQIGQWGWTKHFRVNKTDMQMTFEPTGSQLHFVGLDDVEKLKSIFDPGFAWVEEATELSENDLEQLDLRLRGDRPGHKQIMLSFNPVSAYHWIKTHFYDSPQDGQTTLVKTTFADNRFLKPEDVAKIKRLEHQNKSLWTVYGLGEWGVIEGLIYPDVIFEDTKPGAGDDEDGFDFVSYGLDFGFNNPTALIECGFKDFNSREMTGDIYLDELIYQSGLTTPELGARMKALGLDNGQEIIADSASPDAIKQLRNMGFNVKPVHKGPNSVLQGIRTCQSFKLHSLKSNTNLNKEFMAYVWKQNADGTWQEKPVDFDNHGMDAGRYCISEAVEKPRVGFIDRALLRI